MTRTVFDTAQVAHVWAQGRQAEGRNAARRVYFEGPRLFSYGSHFLTGYRLPDGSALLNSGRYSVSTSRHQQDARFAIPGRVSDVTGQAMRLFVPACLMNAGGRYSSNRGNPLPDFLETRVFRLKCWQRPDGTLTDSPYDRPESEGRPTRIDRETTPADLKAARPALLKLLIEAEEEAPAETVAALFRYAGAKPEEAAKAAEKVKAAHAKRAKEEAAKAARDKAEEAAGDARGAAARPLSDFAGAVQEARADLARANYRGAWERAAEGLLDKARRLFRARKEAKARGWTRVAADCLAREKLLRAGAAGLESFAFKSQERASWGFHKAAIRAGALAMKAGGNPAGRAGALGWIEARKGAEELAFRCRKEGGRGRYYAARAALVGADLARMAEGLEALAGAFQEREEAAKAEERREALAKAATALAAWRDDSGPLPGGRLSDPEGGALIRAARVTRDDSGAITGGRLETSWGAQVPLLEAIKAFRFLKLCRDTGRGWKANGATLPVGHFRVDSVDPSGNFRAGCHAINWPEVAALAARLGLSDLAPADTTSHKAESV